MSPDCVAAMQLFDSLKVVGEPKLLRGAVNAVQLATLPGEEVELFDLDSNLARTLLSYSAQKGNLIADGVFVWRTQTEVRVIVVELKGKKLKHAIEQASRTCDLVTARLPKGCAVKLRAFIACSSAAGHQVLPYKVAFQKRHSFPPTIRHRPRGSDTVDLRKEFS